MDACVCYAVVCRLACNIGGLMAVVRRPKRDIVPRGKGYCSPEGAAIHVLGVMIEWWSARDKRRKWRKALCQCPFCIQPKSKLRLHSENPVPNRPKDGTALYSHYNQQQFISVEKVWVKDRTLMQYPEGGVWEYFQAERITWGSWDVGSPKNWYSRLQKNWVVTIICNFNYKSVCCVESHCSWHGLTEPIEKSASYGVGSDIKC
jgi:hypothetical protein